MNDLIFIIVMVVCGFIAFSCGHSLLHGQSNERTKTQQRGVPDDKLPFVATSNLLILAIATLMEAQGANDQKLIDELRKRGRAEK